ncbi:MAG TPA: glycosyltransferase family 39 protein [Phycisphaerae bacterium]|nr:glycosyltransferase family 39 protein [Phycisphaerae bacterium]HNU44037.1 glycosyltransferase family 39 protein [Phycisphaerae bacterium]
MEPGNTTDQRPSGLPRGSPPPGGLRRLAAHPAVRAGVALALLVLIVYVPTIGWGLPATASWSQDSIAGVRTLGAVEEWPRQWHGRYPPLHYFILHTVYKPVLRYWDSTGARQVDPQTGTVQLRPPHAPRIGLLLLIARWVSVLMAWAAGMAVWATTRRLVQHDTAALVAAAALLSAPGFAYFGQLGNVDVPSICWFAWSMYFYVRSVRTRALADAVGLGLLGSLAVSTKDAVAGMFPGMALALLIWDFRHHHADQRWSRALVRAVAQWRWAAGAAAFVLPYLFLNGVFFDAGPYVTRMEYWLGVTPDTQHARQYRWPNQGWLLLATGWHGAAAVGWPLLAAMLAACVYAFRRYRALTWTLLLPAVSYYAIVIAPLHFVYERFLFPVFVPGSILLGIAAVEWWRGRWPTWVRTALVSVALLSLGYTVSLKLEMLTDSRYAAERWFQRNVEPTASVGASSKPEYLPRLPELGYATYLLHLEQATFGVPQPECLVLTSYDYEDYDPVQRACMDELIKGRLGYEVVATFRGRFLGTGSFWLSVAGWGTPSLGKVSPTLIVLRRGEEPGG